MRLLPLSALSCLLAVPCALADQQDYLDDRSSPSALVRSLYNAINREEYARALSYFAIAPTDTVEEFAATFAGMERMRLATGRPHERETPEGTVFDVPLAIALEPTESEMRVLAGCYTVLGAGVVADEENFQPLRIGDGLVEPTDAELGDALPTRCGDGPEMVPTDLVMERARKLFTHRFDGICLDEPFEDAEQPESYSIAFRRPFDDIDAEPSEVRLFRFFCARGAYNQIHVHLLAEDTGEIRPVGFAVPELDIRYEDESTLEEVRSIDVIGYTSRPELVNSQFDPETLSMTAHAMWRGLGDASASGKWIFRSGTFTLVRYEVDASYDGEINPVTVIDYISGP